MGWGAANYGAEMGRLCGGVVGRRASSTTTTTSTTVNGYNNKKKKKNERVGGDGGEGKEGRKKRLYYAFGGGSMGERRRGQGDGGGEAAERALERLGLASGASQQQVKRAYRKLALQFHPDVCKNESSDATFMEINGAYQTIMDCVHGETSPLDVEPFVQEEMMGVNDETWDDWEEWMGWEGASGSRDYTSHINLSI